MIKKPRVVSMNMKKQEIFDAGKILWDNHIRLQHAYMELEKTNISLLKSLQWVLRDLDMELDFEYPAEPPEEKKEETMEVQ